MDDRNTKPGRAKTAIDDFFQSLTGENVREYSLAIGRVGKGCAALVLTGGAADKNFAEGATIQEVNELAAYFIKKAENHTFFKFSAGFLDSDLYKSCKKAKEKSGSKESIEILRNFEETKSRMTGHVNGMITSASKIEGFEGRLKISIPQITQKEPVFIDGKKYVSYSVAIRNLNKTSDTDFYTEELKDEEFKELRNHAVQVLKERRDIVSGKKIER